MTNNNNEINGLIAIKLLSCYLRSYLTNPVLKN
jgi:hypothetical protein